MTKFKNANEITRFFVDDGWGKDTNFSELSEAEAKERGLHFAIRGMEKGRKYFKMAVSGNIFDDNGKIAMYNI